jgi:hypothetical protein
MVCNMFAAFGDIIVSITNKYMNKDIKAKKVKNKKRSNTSKKEVS